MSVLPSQAVSITFRTKNIDGELADATGTITAVLYRNGAATMVAVTVASITGTGRYSASWTNAGYAVADQLEVEVTATVGGTAYTSKVWGDGVVAVVVAPDNASITAIKAKTDNLPASPAAVGSSMVASNMRGTDGANTTTPPTVGAIATAVWDYAIASTTTAGSIGKTLLDRVTGLLQTKAQADTDQTAVIAALGNVPSATDLAAINANVLALSVAYGLGEVAGDEIELQLSDDGDRQITWPTPSETITGTIQWDGQVAKAITGAITFRESLNGVDFYTWTYDGADRPTEETYGVIALTDGTVTAVVPVTFVLGDGTVRLVGPNTVEVTVVDDSLTPVPIENARVTLSRTGYSQTNSTDALGEIDPFKVVSATWNITTIASGYTTVSQNVTIAGDDALVITMSELAISVPGDPSLCRLTVGFSTVHGVPIVGAAVTPVLLGSPDLVPGGYALDESSVETTDFNGRIVSDFIQGITIRLDVDYNGKCYQIRVEVPRLASATIQLTV